MLQLMYVMESMEQTLCLDRFAIGFKIDYNFNTLNTIDSKNNNLNLITIQHYHQLSNKPKLIQCS